MLNRVLNSGRIGTRSVRSGLVEPCVCVYGVVSGASDLSKLCSVRSLQMSWRRKLHNVDTLSTLARKAVVRELGETANAINGRFSCGGAVAGGKPVKVAYETESGGLKQIVFPVVQQDDIKQLLDACSVASFGLGSKTVTDPSYRDAYRLDSDRFTTSFNLCDTSILIEIAHTLESDYKKPVKKVKRKTGKRPCIAEYSAN